MTTWPLVLYLEERTTANAVRWGLGIQSKMCAMAQSEAIWQDTSEFNFKMLADVWDPRRGVRQCRLMLTADCHAPLSDTFAMSQKVVRTPA